MSFSRYSFVKKISFNNRLLYGTNRNNVIIFNAIESGVLPFTSYVVKENDRLDIIAGKVYGNSNYWWVIAAASGIGWNLQIPPGTFVRYPNSIDDVFELLT